MSSDSYARRFSTFDIEKYSALIKKIACDRSTRTYAYKLSTPMILKSLELETERFSVIYIRIVTSDTFALIFKMS